ncbi:helix-turn-helix domain-containing protein [Spirosoma aerolatum]|uniref:helix-turn-helix domain-containing protein n=1 Tax=Spirosoma aerolatum TaxID=1211326 RepID=UPI001FE82C06|nr:helix-turn-helix domain-containing protein [Spirosoma aerolatum]
MRTSVRLFTTIALMLSGVLIILFARLTPSAPTTEKSHFVRKVNLALRRTAHHLLHKAGDDTSRIAPVQQPNAQTFLIRLDHAFDYDQLPQLLKESFAVHAIRDNYDVAVLDCARGELQLGYNINDLVGTGQVPCGGRKQKAGCYTLQVTFNTLQDESPQPVMVWWVLALSACLTGLGYVVWKKWPSEQTSTEVPNPDSVSDGLLRFGTSSFSPKTLMLHVGTNHHTLTYREAKLLQFFIDHTNQVTERDFILKSVWEDEGVFVGRSVDVFVSRLRKLLQDDSAVRIVAVHGVGYRFEVQV